MFAQDTKETKEMKAPLWRLKTGGSAEWCVTVNRH